MCLESRNRVDKSADITVESINYTYKLVKLSLFINASMRFLNDQSIIITI